MSLIAGQNVILFTGTSVPLTVPTDGTITAYVYGAAGSGRVEAIGGGGGYITADFNVISGDVVYVKVGGKNGYNGGVVGGGGFSNVGLNSIPYLLIAGGGGSSQLSNDTGGNGGGGGGFTGGGGYDGGGGGGTQSAGGSGGGTGAPGTQFNGGAPTGDGGGGGGGWYGGGAGDDTGGGGGGSSYPDPSIFPSSILTNIVTLGPTFDGSSAGTGQLGYQSGVGDATTGSGNGLVVLDYTPNIVCFLKGTLVLTPSGNIPIEDITTNSFVNNQHGKPVKVIYTTSRTFSYAAHPDVMYKIPKDARGNTTDLFITKQHPFFINGERKEARDLGFTVASEAEVVDENGNITVYNISIVDGNTKNLILVNGHCEIGTGET